MVRQDFPYEPDIYPIGFNLEPLTRHGVAKYTYTEAPAGATDPRTANSPQEEAFVRTLLDELGSGTRPNHVGSLYNTLIATLDEMTAGSPALVDRFVPWRVRLLEIQGEGEVHAEFSSEVFLALRRAIRRPLSQPSRRWRRDAQSARRRCSTASRRSSRTEKRDTAKHKKKKTSAANT